MSLTPEQLEQCVDIVEHGEAERQEIDRLTEQYPNLTMEEAYDIQQRLIARKQEQGQRVLGRKLGLTSRAKQQMMGVHEPTYGTLVDYMLINEGEPVCYSELIHPKAEPEIAFYLKEDLEGPAVTGAQVLAATEYVFPALEIIDSRYRDFKFTLVDVIADNSSSARYVLGGKPSRVTDLDLSLMGMVFYKNGEIVDTAAGAAVLGHPATAVAWLVRKLHERGEKLCKGDVVLSGALTGAIDFRPGDIVQAHFEKLGSVTLTCKE
ncbi:2-oxo-3-hexenedioate decarboxylase [Aneurinibacillus soli]|uniref:2-oxopent-4-enoate hydratase n=1 Tax=Aneurinibacillus soli TaxID=1500254 RepID=A0A0U5BDI8_9BACL|nr:fumarylacetoacetate hydrolase family protein [Aneurinibacillus soli]PYE64330.1 2-oxo-3-hexenedioate decarboxylase [Aneurinibacillus soli]BAU28279.1 2-oxopent-4-enoate hydratase [Aneurinibacillus soli]